MRQSKMSLLSHNYVFLLLFISCVLCENKYSRSANEKTKEIDFRTLEKPFRMHKLNLLWKKGQMRLSEPKLKSLYTDLSIQDKQELIHKRVKSEGQDKEGLKESELRRKLTNIMNNYGLREHFEDNVVRQKDHPAFNSAIDDHINKSLFKDKKLNMLWTKAEMSGFTSEELAALKEEFTHHQDKIDQYYDLLNRMEDEKKDGYQNVLNEEEEIRFNEIDDQLETNEISKDFVSKANLIRDKHRGLRDGYDRLQRIAARGPDNKEFIEPKVQGLWRMATASNFTVAELESLKVAAAGDKMDLFDEQQQMIKKHTRKVEKMHDDLESRILERHSEL